MRAGIECQNLYRLLMLNLFFNHYRIKFQAVGLGGAMENASDELKAVADDTCGHVANDGIYHYCMEHKLM